MKAIGIMLLFILLAACSSGNVSRRDLTCQSEETVLTGYSGIGITHSMNVRVMLKSASGRSITPSENIPGETANGIEYLAKIYYEQDVATGTYAVEVSTTQGLLETYMLTLSNNHSPMLTIFCR